MNEFLVILVILLRVVVMIICVALAFASSVRSAHRKGYEGRNPFKGLDLRGAVELAISECTSLRVIETAISRNKRKLSNPLFAI